MTATNDHQPAPAIAVRNLVKNYDQVKAVRGVEFEVTNSHSTFFADGKLAIRADFRCAFIVYRPKAFATVTGL